MIRINLLPEDLRKAERTSPRVLLALVGGVILVCSTAAYYLNLRLGDLREALLKKETVESTWSSLQPYVQYADALAVEEREYSKRTTILQNIGDSRILWSQKIDQLYDVIHNGGNTERHLVWLRSIHFSEVANGSGEGVLRLSGYCGTDQLAKVANFREDLVAGPLFGDFKRISTPNVTVKAFEELNPREAFEFDNFSLTLKTAEERKAAAAQRPAGSAARATVGGR